MSDLTGTITEIHKIESGEGRNGTWQKQAFLINTGGQYARDVYFSCFGERNMQQLSPCKVGDNVKVYFDPKSRESSGKYYTELNVFRIDRA